MLANILQSQNLNLIVSGNSDQETKVIDSIGYKNLFFNYSSLNNEVVTLKNKLEKIGFIETKLLQTKKLNDSTYQSKFDLGKKYSTIYIHYNNEIISSSFLKPLVKEINSSTFRISISNIPTTLSKINSYLIENGFSFSNVKLSNIEKESEAGNIIGELIVELNTERVIDNIIVKGYENFPKSFLKHYLKLKPNKTLNINSLKEKVNVLNTLAFANTTREPEILFTKDSSQVYLYIERRKSNTFDGFLGFGSNEASSKLEFDGYLDFTLTNNLNYGESINLIYKSDENEQKTFNANITAPYIFNTPIGAELNINIFKKDSTFTTTGQSGNLFYQINNNQILYIGLESVKSNSLNSNSSTLNIEDYNSTFYNIKYQLFKSQYNNILFPNNFKLDIKVGLGNRNNNGINTKQIIYGINAYKLFKLNTKNNIFLKINSSGIDSNNYFSNELLRFGGINSIRGFEENSLFATYYGFVNLEYRYNLSPSIFLHTITDAAYLKNNLENIDENLYGFGFGLGVLTKAGLLKLNYASGKTKSQKLQLSNSKIHISLSTKF